MRHLTVLLACLSFSAIIPSSSICQVEKDSSDTAASRGLRAFEKLITPDNLHAMGFESLSEVPSASLGEPMRVFAIPLEPLKRYEPGQDPSGLLEDWKTVIYPVLVDSNVRSSVTVEQREQRWEATNFGAPQLTRLLTETRARQSQAVKMPPSAFFLVRVPALNLYFIAYRRDGTLMLTSILDDKSLNLVAGESRPATEVIDSLLPVAKAHNGLPR